MEWNPNGARLLKGVEVRSLLDYEINFWMETNLHFWEALQCMALKMPRKIMHESHQKNEKGSI